MNTLMIILLVLAAIYFAPYIIGSLIMLGIMFMCAVIMLATLVFLAGLMMIVFWPITIFVIILASIL